MGARTLLVTHKLATDRRHVLQPGDRRAGPRPPGARDRRAGRGHGAGDRRRPASSSGCSTAARVRPCRGRGRRPTAGSTPGRCATCSTDQPNLELREGEVDDCWSSDGPGGRRRRPYRDGVAGRCRVLTTGTFLRGEIHLGEERWPAGRVGDRPSVRLAAEPAAAWAAARAAEDRHAAAPGRADDRPRRACSGSRATIRRCRSRS